MKILLLETVCKLGYRTLPFRNMQNKAQKMGQKKRELQNILYRVLSILRISIFVSGDYVCFHKRGDVVERVFGAHSPADGPTIFQGPHGWFRGVKLTLAPSERILVGSSIFGFPAISADIAAALEQPSASAAAKTAWQNAVIRGLSGNIALAVLDPV